MISIAVYAQALFEVADGRALKFYDSIRNFEELLKDSDVMATFSRTYGDAAVLDPVFSLLDYDSEVLKILKIMQGSRLLNDFSRFTQAYRDLLIQKDYLVDVEVVSAVEIEDFSDLLASIAKRYKGRVELNYSVDKSLIKGMVLRVNSDLYDTSIKRRLDSVLKEARV